MEDGLRMTVLFPKQLENRMFMRDFYANVGAYFRGSRGLVLHGGNEKSVSALGLQSKKIAAGLSEEMITNVAFSGFQRNLIAPSHYGPEIRVSVLKELYNTVNVVVVNTLTTGEKYLEPDGDFIASLVPQLENEFGTVRTLLFPLNPLSALGGTEPARINGHADAERLLSLFPEEKSILNLAKRAIPCLVAQPTQLNKL